MFNISVMLSDDVVYDRTILSRRLQQKLSTIHTGEAVYIHVRHFCK